MSDNKFCVDYGKRVAGCKKCKQKIEKGDVRIAKITSNPFNEEGEMKNYHHPICIFQTFLKARATTKIIEDPGDLDGWSEIKDEDKQVILALIRDTAAEKNKDGPKKKTPTKSPGVKKTASPGVKKEKKPKTPEIKEEAMIKTEETTTSRPVSGDPNHKDNSFRQFQKICSKIRETPSYLKKTEIYSAFFKKGTGTEFQGDLFLWVKLLLPGVVKRIYNMQNKQLIKIFSRIFDTDEDAMLEDLEQGDVAETISVFYSKSSRVNQVTDGTLFLHEVDEFLDKLSRLTKEEEQQHMLSKVVKRSTVNDLRMFVRLMKGDLKIQAGPKHVLEALHPDANDAFNSSRNIDKVIQKILELRNAGTPHGKLEIGASLMQPVQPMLAAPCKSVDMAFQKCPNGIFSEIKYDGERVQVHKRGSDFKYYSRSLKPVMAHKVKHFKEFIPKAFPSAADLIIDAEVLLVDNRTGNPLPFGSLGIHKGSDFKDADPCLFVFDCIFYNGESLMHRSLKDRRRFLKENMTEVGNRIKLSEIKHITKKPDLVDMIKDVFKKGLEGLMIKDIKSTYEPGKRHWLKIKKDYLNEGAMADTADLVVLGGWYGSGQKGGLISIFLMGCRDSESETWYTVSKVHTGHDDATLDRLQGELLPNMIKIKGDHNRVPGWLKINRTMVPDFVVKDPNDSPVWEITGAEFSKAELHTASGISIRFPRVTRIREDKTVDTATNLQELEELYKASKQHMDIDLESFKPEDGSPTKNSSPETSREKKRAHSSTTSSPVKRMKNEDAGNIGSGKKRENGTPIKNNNLENKITQASSGFTLETKNGDLFSSPDSSSLAHCISVDCKLGKGIAKIFREKFGRIKEIEDCKATVGGLAVLRDKSRFIYNLVTKEKYYGKPSYETLRQSLEKMKEHVVKNKVTEICMPKIGCGLDGLNWSAVRTLIKNVFQSEQVHITVFVLEGAQETKDSRTPDKGNYGEEKRGNEEKNQPKIPPNPRDSKQGSVRDYFTKFKDKPTSKEETKPRREDEKRKDILREPETSKEESSSKHVDVGCGFKTRNPLPDVFCGLRIKLSKDSPNYDILRRSIVGLGGKCLDTADTASHIVYLSDESLRAQSGCKHVRLQWLEDSIKLGKLQPEKYYSV